MNILYGLKYQERFNDIINLLNESDKNILDLCFGDIYIAEYCMKHNKTWMGYDISEYFCNRAIGFGYNAQVADIVKIEKFPAATTIIMCGSLYHFSDKIDILLKKMLNSANKIIISEPIKNLSSGNGIISKLSKIFTNAGKGKEEFRYNKETIIQMLEQYKDSLMFTYKIVSVKRDILIQITKK